MHSVDPDQTAPLGAVWSGSALFAQTCLSKNLGTLWYVKITYYVIFFFNLFIIFLLTNCFVD